MSDQNPHENAYSALLADDASAGDAHWAFGTDFEDPLAGVDTTVPDGADPAELAVYCLMLGDDALVLAQRLAEWCSRAPDLEEDIALANIALDLLGQARLLLSRAAAADPRVVPALPDGSPVPDEDRLAFFRAGSAFRNVRLCEAPNGDFAETIARILLFSAWRYALFARLADSRDPVLAAIAAKGVKELAYHRDFAGRWFVTLARGTAESRRRLTAALDGLWPLYDEPFHTHEVERSLTDAGIGVDPALLAADVDAALAPVLAASGLSQPSVAAVAGASGRDGRHTPALTALLTDMQSVARAHPEGRW
ncbi:MAG: 1,2-phenylacetyl-CoA epoxidase subunit PaaC [Microbacterium sp.]